MKLTPKQKQVVKDLQNGFILITDSSMKGADVARYSGETYHISNRVFWNLVDLKLIFQNNYEHFNYTLTDFGKQAEID